MSEVESPTTSSGADEQTSESTSAATVNTGRSTMVDRERFDEVNDRMKAAEQERDEMRGRLEVLEENLERERARAQQQTPRQATATDGLSPLPNPPAELGDDVGLRNAWLMREGSKRFMEGGFESWFEEKYGMKPGDLVTAAKAIPEAARSSQMTQYQIACREHGLDPKNKELAQFVGRMVKGGAKFDDELLNQAKKLFGSSESNGKKPPPPIETDGVGSVMVQEDLWVTDRAGAEKAAREGKKMPHHPVTEILQKAVNRKRT